MYASNSSHNLTNDLREKRISPQEAIAKVVNPDDRTVNFDLIDPEVNDRTVKLFVKNKLSFPVILLLLWRGCYYFGSATPLSLEDTQLLEYRLEAKVKIIHIHPNSYRQWIRQQNISAATASTSAIDTRLAILDEDICKIMRKQIANAPDQTSRIRAIFTCALRYRASDIHCEPTPEGLQVRFRIDGVLRSIICLSPDYSRQIVVALKVWADLDIAESRRPQDGRIGEKYVTEGNEAAKLDMRVSTLPCMGGEKVVIRLLPQDNPFSTLDSLGFTSSALKLYQHWLNQPQGLIVLTGPTGSGKTSTLYTSLQAIATEGVNVTTVEDPVEYILPKITQTQVNIAAGMTFIAGLRAILRQDPDVILVGETRDEETAETAVRAALTGHLVFTTLHTNDAAGAIPRLRNIGPDPSMIADALLGVVAQRLVRRVCPHCAEPHKPSSDELQMLGLSIDRLDFSTWRKGRGCSKCFETGYLGREAIAEIMTADRTIKQIIYDGSFSRLKPYLQESGYTSFRTAAIEKVKSGVTTVSEIQRVLPQSALFEETS
jgi:general secretion pathway protein E